MTGVDGNRDTIPRNATRRIAAIKAQPLTCTAHCRRNGYQDVPCDPEWAWRQLHYHGSRLHDLGEGRWKIRMQSGEWYELTVAAKS